MATKQRYRKPNEVKELERLCYEYKLNHYENTPKHAIVKPKFRDDNTNGLTKCIISYCRVKGIHAERVGNTGRNLNGKWIKGTGENGTADIHAIHNGKALMIEIKCKATKDRQSKDQKTYQKSVERAGGTYLIVREFRDFYNFLSNANE